MYTCTVYCIIYLDYEYTDVVFEQNNILQSRIAILER